MYTNEKILNELNYIKNFEENLKSLKREILKKAENLEFSTYWKKEKWLQNELRKFLRNYKNLKDKYIEGIKQLDVLSQTIIFQYIFSKVELEKLSKEFNIPLSKIKNIIASSILTIKKFLNSKKNHKVYSCDYTNFNEEMKEYCILANLIENTQKQIQYEDIYRIKNNKKTDANSLEIKKLGVSFYEQLTKCEKK